MPNPDSPLTVAEATAVLREIAALAKGARLALTGSGQEVAYGRIEKLAEDALTALHTRDFNRGVLDIPEQSPPRTSLP